MNTHLQVADRRDRLNIDQCIMAWINAKASKSQSTKTRAAYMDTLQHFRSMLQVNGLDLDYDPFTIAPLAQGYAGFTETRDHVASATYNQRLAILSSFYKYAIMNGVLSSNPIEKVERRTVKNDQAARPIAAPAVKVGLASIDRSSIEGKRDYAMLSIALGTGRRVSEIASLTYGNIQKQGTMAQVIFTHCKGNKQMIDTLPPAVTKVLYDYLYAAYGSELGKLDKDAPVWVSFSDRCKGKAISARTIQRTCEKYLGTSKAHATRHTWAVEMDKKNASIQTISKGLGHSNIATTSRYMDDLKGYENPYAASLADTWGIE